MAVPTRHQAWGTRTHCVHNPNLVARETVPIIDMTLARVKPFLNPRTVAATPGGWGRAASWF